MIITVSTIDRLTGMFTHAFEQAAILLQDPVPGTLEQVLALKYCVQLAQHVKKASIAIGLTEQMQDWVAQKEKHEEILADILRTNAQRRATELQCDVVLANSLSCDLAALHSYIAAHYDFQLRSVLRQPPAQVTIEHVCERLTLVQQWIARVINFDENPPIPTQEEVKWAEIINGLLGELAEVACQFVGFSSFHIEELVDSVEPWVDLKEELARAVAYEVEETGQNADILTEARMIACVQVTHAMALVRAYANHQDCMGVSKEDGLSDD